MKKNVLFFIFFISVLFLSSCATEMEVNKTARQYVPEVLVANGSPDIEFIGFKADTNTLSTTMGDTIFYTGAWARESYTFPSDFELWKKYKSDTCLKNLGSVLEKNNVAYDQSFAYFGIYSLQELELYKSQKRFVTFIEIDKHRLSGNIKDPTLIPGSCALGAGLGLVISAGPLLIIDPDADIELRNMEKTCTAIGFGATALGAALLAVPAKTDMTFEGLYQIYVYDTQDKKIIYKDGISIYEEDTFKGSYFDEQTNKNVVNNYYATLVYNEILKKYEEVYAFLLNYK